MLHHAGSAVDSRLSSLRGLKHFPGKGSDLHNKRSAPGGHLSADPYSQPIIAVAAETATSPAAAAEVCRSQHGPVSKKPYAGQA